MHSRSIVGIHALVKFTITRCIYQQGTQCQASEKEITLCSLLAVQDSSIGDLDTDSLTHWVSDSPFDFRVIRSLQRCRRDIWPFWQRQRHWKRFSDLVTQLTVPDKLRDLNPKIEGLWLTVREWVTWTVFAILAIFFCKTFQRHKGFKSWVLSPK